MLTPIDLKKWSNPSKAEGAGPNIGGSSAADRPCVALFTLDDKQESTFITKEPGKVEAGMSVVSSEREWTGSGFLAKC